ncbi:LamG-like jellyroll fold domain-containing protein [Flavobacteriaceae sp. LMIT009]
MTTLLLTSQVISAQYCTPSGNQWTAITGVQFNTINNSTGHDDYTYYSAISTTVVQSSSYNLTVNLNTAGNWTAHSIAWIDWNQDNVFDAGESYDLGTAHDVTDGPTSLSPLSITVPAGATLGTTRMRVSAQYDFDPGPCDTNMDGEVEDYPIVVNAAVPAPEINVLGNAITIIDGDTTPSLDDDTAHGVLSVGNTSAKVYTIENTGNLDLTISSITLSNNTDFSITGTPYSSPVAGSGSTTFEVTFNALEEGTKTTTVTIANNDADEGTYQFDITATAEDNAPTLTDFTAGAAVIDMGVSPQTINNGLRPYGLIQDLVSVHEIPVFWIINDSKSFVSGAAKVDQTDLTITGTVDSDPASTPITTDLKSGPFLIPSEFMPEAQAVIESWIATSDGGGTDKLTVYWNLDAITDAPVHGIISYFPDVTLYPVGGDPSNGADTDIETVFYNPAGITTGFTKKAPDQLGSCDLIYVLSHHTDPDTDWNQADIDTFYDFVMAGGNAWMGCHDVSLTENVLTTTGGTQLNFLSNGGLLPYKDLTNISSNYPWLSDFADGGDDILEHDNTFNNADILYDIDTAPNPLMQFMGEIHPAMNGNSERIYVPLADAGSSQGGWRSTTTVSIYDPNNSHIPSRSPGKAGVMVYGPAYGDTDNGTIVYQGSHISSGNNVVNFDHEHIGEIRVFANFLLQSALEVTPQITIPELPYATFDCGDENLSVNATVDNIPFNNNTYQWSYEVISGTSTDPVTFTPDNAASTTMHFPENPGPVVFKIILTFTSTPDGGCTNPVTSKFISYVSINESTTADAGPDQIVASAYCGTNEVQLAASNTAGYTGTWTIESGIGGSFSDVNDEDAIFYGVAGQTYTLKWAITCAEDEVTIGLPSDCENIDFDGSNDYISFNDNYDFNSNFSIEVWVKPESLSGTQRIFSKRDLDNMGTGYDLKLVNSTISFNWNAAGTIASPYALTTNRWYHIAITFDGSNYYLYIDGIQVNSVAGVLPTANDLDCIVGAMDQTGSPPFNPPVQYFTGWLDELRIWNTALTQLQIREMMNQEIEANGANISGSTIPMNISNLNWNTDLLGYYQMNQGSDVVSGNIIEIKDGVINGKLRNITTPQDETSPLPYTTKANGNWNDTTATTPWTYGDTVWDSPNAVGIDGSTIITWNIVQTDHDVAIDTYDNLSREREVLGLIVNNNELTVNGSHELDSGNGLTITNYLKLDGTLDLEGESQLIQSEGSILDISSGGIIERDQQGTQDFYTYNYWAAPVGISNTISNNNNYTLPDVMKDGTDASNPITINWSTSGYNGSTGPPITIADYWIWKYANQISDNYPSWQHVRSTGSLQPGEGFTMKGTADTGGIITNEQNYVFNGKPHNGDITLTLSTGNDYLIGNPYASAIDADEFILDNISDGPGRAASNIIDGALYFWDHFASSTHYLGEYQGGYATYTLLGGTVAISNDIRINNNGAIGSKEPEQFVPVGQGFFVTADDGGTVTFKNSQRTFKTESLGSSIFMRANNKKSKENTEASNSRSSTLDTRSKIRLMLSSPKGYNRQLLLGTDENASPIFDRGYDGPLIENNTEDMFWVANDKKYIIQAVNNFEDSNVFPLGLKISQQGEVSIKIDELENIPDSLDIFFHDKELNTFHDLNLMTFKINLEAGEYLERFELIFNNSSLSIDEIDSKTVDIFYSNSEKSIIINNPKGHKITTVYMVNMLGQEVFSSRKFNKAANHINLKPSQLSTGAYIISVITDKGSVSKKVIVK